MWIGLECPVSMGQFWLVRGILYWNCHIEGANPLSRLKNSFVHGGLAQLEQLCGLVQVVGSVHGVLGTWMTVAVVTFDDSENASTTDSVMEVDEPQAIEPETSTPASFPPSDPADFPNIPVTPTSPLIDDAQVFCSDVVIVET